LAAILDNGATLPAKFTPELKQALDVYYKRCEYEGKAPTDQGRYEAMVAAMKSDHMTEEDC
jgi:hypothetical protein